MKTKTITYRKNHTREINCLSEDCDITVLCYFKKKTGEWIYLHTETISFYSRKDAEIFFKSIKRRMRYQKIEASV